jgi:hypothetical protein
VGVALAGRAFGAGRANGMFGWIIAAHPIGAGTLGVGYQRTTEEDYHHAFTISAVL